MKASTSAPRAPTGLITYMRTDSPRVAPEAITGAREWIGKELGAQYLPETPNVYKGKKEAQDAHEAIRPTDAARTPESIAQLSERRAAQALHADLAALRGLADDAGDLRRDHSEDRSGLRARRRRLTISASRVRCCASTDS